MYDYITGIISYLSGVMMVVEQSGIGYRILCADPSRYRSLIGRKAKVYIYQYVREDALILYGFHSREERELFVRLLSVSGIGPKNALAILAVGDYEAVVRAIESEDRNYLTRFPGIGKKTAGQIILDLKGKLSGLVTTNAQREGGVPVQDKLNEVEEALKALGYSDNEINRVLPKLDGVKQSVEDNVKEALRLLMKK
ncbi:MAG: Holliday junction branch migration protein RuvA [Sporolactobacillus sp.]|nr:Holliday junction branch migration protein RuvA [Sporolactobacillus sp.]